jgi:acetolactate synthase-1/2/3 large subunit
MPAPSPPAKPTVADQLLDYLALEGATKIFGLPGAGIAHLLQRVKARPEFSYVVCRHESGAAYMADGYFRATGKPGVVLVTSGPGATNALTGTMNANFGGSAIIVLTGEVPQAFLGRGYLQEGTDCGLNVRDIYAAATRYSADIAAAAGAPIVIEQALRDMMSVPERAVRLGISDNVAAEPAADSYSARPPKVATVYRSQPRAVAAEGVRRILEVLSSAKRPLLMLGNGCRQAVRDPATARALRCLVEWWQIPVITTSDGKGVFPETHELSLRAYGFAGCEWPQYWMLGKDGKAVHDALVVVGSSLGELATYKWNPMLVPPQGGPFIQVDIDPSMIGRGFPVTEGFVGEAGALFREAWEQAPSWPRDEKAVAARGAEIAAIRKDHSPFHAPEQYSSETAPLQPAALCRVLNDLLPDDAFIFVDCGNCVGWSLHSLIVGGRKELHSALAMGPMGFGVCAVVGARLGKPERLAVALVGDGAFLMQAGEISTAAGHGIGAVWVVLIDDDLRMVSQGMEMMFPKDPSYDNDYRLGKADLAKVAAGLGADVTVVNKPADLTAAWPNVTNGAKAGRPQVVLAMIDKTAEPPYWTKPYWQAVAD